jgi:hypothetical protein
MARESNSQRLARIHQEALREFDDIQSALRDERLQCLQDRRFYSIAGAQWEGPLGEQFSNKPKFEVNKIALAVQRIFNEYRNNRITVNFMSKDGVADDSLADTCNKLFRADQQDSSAEEAYDNAFEEAVGGGFGAWELRPVYEDEEDPDNDSQRIRIEPIYDADSSVFFDLQAKRQDKADATRCYVLTSMTRSAYKDQYGDDPASWPKEIYQYEFDWCTPDVVFVARYYRVEMVSRRIHYYEMIDGTEKRYESDELTDEKITELDSIGAREVRTRDIKRKRVRLYIMSGSRILNDVGYIAGQCIPVIPVYGKRWFIDNVERCMGHVRLSKDAQRLGNMQRSKLGEISALSSVEKPIFTPEQIAGHQNMWAEDNVKNYPYLLVNPVMGPDGNMTIAGPVSYTKSAAVPPALAGLLQITEQDLKDTLGNQEQGDRIVSNISGRAVEMVQQRLDMQSFLYISNFSKASRREGEVWLSMAADIYIESGRKMKGLGDQGELSMIELLKPKVDQETGEVIYENDLSQAKLDVVSSVGPSFVSQRAAIVRALTGMLAITQDPQTQSVLQAMAIMNMEGEGLKEAREYFRRKLVEIGVVKPNEKEAEALMSAMQNKRPDPNTIYLEAAAQEAVAKAEKARADVVNTVADARLKQAKTAEIESNIRLDSDRATLDAIESIRQTTMGVR